MGGRFRAELRVVFETDVGLYHVLTLKADQKGNVYILPRHPLLGEGKTSHHPSGTTTYEYSIGPLRRREVKQGRPLGAPSEPRRMKGVSGGGTASFEPGALISNVKSDTRVRKTLTLPWPREPNRVWGWEFWVIPPGADKHLVEAARELAPWPDCSVVGVVSSPSDFEPELFLKVWRGDADPPYDVYEAINHVTGERFIRLPADYVGTPFERAQGEDARWLPPPRPPETYGPEPWDTHPALHPELFTSLDEE